MHERAVQGWKAELRCVFGIRIYRVIESLTFAGWLRSLKAQLMSEIVKEEVQRGNVGNEINLLKIFFLKSFPFSNEPKATCERICWLQISRKL